MSTEANRIVQKLWNYSTMVANARQSLPVLSTASTHGEPLAVDALPYLN
ncbi:MAG: hypothetical protein VKM17_04485 [Cyanobacteriota bacterium]|jgi:hypothetical protein|nr:hypothetical protein [Cyanobacteriota bacterium]